MTIKEVEEKTGLARSNVRFYEKEELIHPKRTANGYRDYSDDEVDNLKKIAWLRTLGVSVDDIRKIITNELSLQEAIQNRAISLQEEMTALKNSEQICNLILQNGNVDFEHLEVETYTPNIEKYWQENKNILHLDSVGFFLFWGSTLMWWAITIICVCVATIAFRFLPDRIPIQWNQGEISQTASKWFIFAYPAACIIIRFLLKPFLARKLWQMGYIDYTLEDYITNYLCLLALIVETFTILNLIYDVGHIQIWIIISALLFACIWLAVRKSINRQMAKKKDK